MMSFVSFFYRYNVPWYQAPLHIQKLILFLLQRNSKAFTISVGGLFVLFLKCFASVKFCCISEHVYKYNNIVQIIEIVLRKMYLFAVGKYICILFHCYVVFVDITKVRFF